MGQLFSSPPAASNIRTRGRPPISHSRGSEGNRAFKSPIRSRRRSKSPVQYHDYRSSHAALYDNAKTKYPTSKSRSSKHLDDHGNSKPRRPEEFENGVRTNRRYQRKSVSAGNPRKDGAVTPLSTTTRQRTLQKSEARSSPRSHGHRQSRPKKTKECMVCTDTRSLHRFPNRPPTTQCTHEVDVCRKCLRTWIASEFSTKIWDEINCPTCSKRMQYADMREFASSNVFDRYDELSTRAAFEAIPGFRWCIMKGCKSGQVHPMGVPRFRCIACKKTHCIEHSIPWHKGETCREYDYRTNKKLKKAEETASKKWILASTKKCPGCKRNIEKSFGCDHMTCSRCKHEFCWQCLASYAKKHKGRVVHRPGCDYYSPEWDSD